MPAPPLTIKAPVVVEVEGTVLEVETIWFPKEGVILEPCIAADAPTSASSTMKEPFPPPPPPLATGGNIGFDEPI
jgi:hypothetical protein